MARGPVTNAEGRGMPSLDSSTGGAETKVTQRGSEFSGETRRKVTKGGLFAWYGRCNPVSTHRTNLMCDRHCGVTDSEC